MPVQRQSRVRNAAFYAAFLFALICAGPVAALEVPPAPTQWVTDSAGLLDPSQAAALNQKLQGFEQQSGAQFIVYTMKSLEGDPVEDFTIRAAEKWKVGQKKYDNGLILFVFLDEKKVRIETGYGLEGTITDAVASRAIRESMAPHFQRGDWNAGLNAGADFLIERIRKGEAPVEPMRRDGQPGAEITGFDPMFLLVIVALFFFFILPMLKRGGGRGGCSGCIFPFIFPGGGTTFGGHRGGFGGGGLGGFGGGGFGGGGGGFGGGGATGGW